jgi:polyhydroxyalkanoate synthase subunit PhaC
VSATAQDDEAPLDPRILAEIERLVRRGIGGLDFLAKGPPEVGLTPKNVIHSRRPLYLYHYRPTAAEVYRVPLLLVMATTNKGYLFDLAPGQSVVQYLLARGYDVYMLDWRAVYPDESHFSMDDYVLDFIPDCIARVQAHSGEADVSLVGYCAGGVLAVLYAAANPTGPVTNLACLTTPIDFRPMRLFQAWTDRRYLELDRIAEMLGNVPSEMTTTMFEMLRPASRIAGVVQLWDNMWNDEFVRSYRLMSRWAYDALPIAAAYFRQGIRELFWENSLCGGGFRLGGTTVELRHITIPVFHGLAANDHIVPRASTAPLVRLVGSRHAEEAVIGGGHFSVVAGPNATKRLWPRLDAWLAPRSI